MPKQTMVNGSVVAQKLARLSVEESSGKKKTVLVEIYNFKNIRYWKNSILDQLSMSLQLYS